MSGLNFANVALMFLVEHLTNIVSSLFFIYLYKSLLLWHKSPCSSFFVSLKTCILEALKEQFKFDRSFADVY